ncbi:MAG: 4-hydroxy-3-methylbut-2-enyl diphosphate reductase [Gammaproteobacteria bacterium]|nr:4-hydroxy-3-methylbut-2-enyl diphosphate reductase [Gammaproteobacteria bacterium]
MNIMLASPRGFCAGVDRAIGIVERTLALFSPPVYVRHEVVHNRFVVECLREHGAVFIESLDEVPAGSNLIFSAHGVPESVKREAQQRQLKVFDATCPLVTKVHLEVHRYARAGQECVLIGHAGHPEVEGTMGQYDTSQGGRIYLVENVADVEQLKLNNPDSCAFVTQTTLSMDDASAIIAALRQYFPAIQGPKKSDICYATQNRQDAVKILADHCDIILVVGSPNSSNSNRLRELAEKKGVNAYLIDGADDINKTWFTSDSCIGITAGASAPEQLVQQVVDDLVEQGGTVIPQPDAYTEDVTFLLPKDLR